MVHGHFLVVFISLLHLAAAENVKYALLGQTVILDPEIKASGANNILWKHSGNKVVEFNGNEQLEYEPFKDRITLDWHTAELEITDLRYEDSGDYELEMFMNKEFIPFTFKLKVIGKVSRPSISCEIEDTSSDESGNRASLKCSAESSRSESFMKFEWSWRGSMQPGPNLTIPLGDENDEEEYSCTVSNPMSRETTTFSARSCYSETNLAGIIVGCVIAVIAVPLVVLLLFLKRRQRKPEQNRSDPEQNPLMNTQPTSQSPPQPAGFAEENDDTELVDVKKTTQNFQEMIDEHENSTPAKPPGLAKVLSPSKMNFSVTSQEGGIDEHKKENNLDQVSGELPQNPAGESSLEEKNQSDEENRSDPEQRTLNGGLSTSQSPLQSPDCAQEDDGTEPDKGINSPSGKPPHTPKPPSPPAPDSSNTPDEGGIDKHKEDNNSDQITGKLPQDTAGESSLEEGKQQTEVLQGSKPEISHIGIDIPNGADTAAANLAEKDNTVSDSQSTSDNEASDTKEEPAGQQEDQVPVNPTPGDAKDSEMSLAADGVGDSPTETQTSGQIENEPDPENSKQEETKNTKDDQEENQQPESQRSSRQGSHDSLKSAGISTDQTDKQDKVSSRRSSQSENNSKETGGDEGERQDEQRDADASEHVDSAKSVSDKVIDSPTPATGEPSQNPAGESSLEDKNQSDGGKTSDPEHKSNASTEPGPGKGGAASSSGPEGADEHENSTPAKPPGLAKVLSPSKLNFSVTSQEGGIDKQNKENNLDQVSGELPQNPAGESSLEDKKQSDEENRSDPEQRTLNGGLSTSQSPLQSPDCAQEDDDTEPDKGINSPSGKPPHTPTPPSPPAPDPSNIADEGGIDKHEEDNNSDQITGKPPQNPAGESSLEEGKQQTEILQGSKPEVPHIGIDIPNGADTAAANQAEKNNTVSNSQSTSDNEASDTKEKPAGQQEDQVPVNPTPGDAKDSEMSLAVDGVGDSPTETQTSGQIENEPDPENSKQEETKNTKDDQEENQQPESQRSSRQGSHDSLKSAGISTDETDKQDKVSSRRSSQSENNSKETGGDEGERQDEQRDADASEHVDSANSVSDKVIDSPTPATREPSQNPAGESSLEDKNQSDGGKTSDPEHKSNASTEPGPGKGGAASSSGPEGAEQNRSDPEQNPLLNTQPTSQSPPQPAGFAEENDDTESVDVKKTTQNFQQMMVTSQEGGIDKQNKENNLDQVSGELPQNPAGESSLEEKNPSDEENRSDPEQRTLNGGLSTSPSPLQSPDCAQEDDDTEPDKGINSPSGKPPHTPTPLSPPAPDPSNTPDEGGIDKHKEDNNLDQITGKPPQHTTGESSLEEGKHQTEVLQGSKPEIPHIGIDIPIVADTAAANQAEKDNIVSNSQSTSDNEASDTKEEPAGQQEDQVPVNPTPGDAKDSEMSLAADGVGDSPTETQTSGQIENEPDPENSKQEENKNTKDDQEENQQPESQRSSRQGSHDSLKSAGISTDETDKQDKVSSRRSSQSENNSDATGGDEGEKQNEQRDADASEHVDSANSDKESNSPTPATGEPSPNTSGESSSEDKNQSNDKHENSTPAKPPGLAKALSPLKFNFSVTSQEGGIDKQNKENNLDQVSGELPQNPAGESSLEEKNPSDEENKGDPDKGKINNKESEKKRSDGEQNLSVTSPALRLLQGNLTDINTKTTSSQEQDPGSSSGPEGADEEIYATPPRSPEPSPPPATDCSNTPDKPKKGNEVSAEITKKH
ncbi:protein piccolo-like isoform X2 [Salarias fasciatus]|uniref:protein piccolo-like isoform X2 n=1 Tax=Salarias fasciatus TaxID=181472 RepID=UPI001176C328|nr:protein piccolo-like isoform X2 [Salarias fasciatus]